MRGHDLAPLEQGESDRFASSSPAKAKKKLSYKIQREFDELPDKMAKLEHKIEALTNQSAEPDFYTQSADITSSVLNEITQTQESLDLLLDRWVEIEELMS